MNLLKTLNNWLPTSAKNDEKKKEPHKEDPNSLQQSHANDSVSPSHNEHPENGNGENSSSGSREEKSASEETETQRYGVFKALSSKLGMDISVGVTLPVWICEPLTTLQRMCEMVDFSDLLNEAADMENSLDKLAYVAVFAITAYNGTERYSKPFNPVLGETFEYVNEEKGIKYIGEQVSHHPPISAGHCQSEKFTFWQESKAKSKFFGNYVDLDPCSKTHIYFPNSRDHFVYTSVPMSRINNLILGRIWVDHFGTLSITNQRTGDVCTLTFEKCGWLSKGRHEVHGYVKDAEGIEKLHISGKWSSSINVKWLYENGKHPKNTNLTVWKRPEVNAIGKYKLTEFAKSLNVMDVKYEMLLPSTDSRLRPDRRALEKGDMSTAGCAKSRVEDRQRGDKKTRVSKGEEWTPRFFKYLPEENGEGSMWVYTGDYWEKRKQKADLVEKHLKLKAEGSGELTPEEQQQMKELLQKDVVNLACDFSSYNT